MRAQVRFFDRYERKRAFSAQRRARKIQELASIDQSIKEANTVFVEAMNRIWTPQTEQTQSLSDQKEPRAKESKPRSAYPEEFRQNIKFSIQAMNMNIPTELTKDSIKQSSSQQKREKRKGATNRSNSDRGIVSIVLEKESRKQGRINEKINGNGSEISAELLEYKYSDLYTNEQHQDMKLSEKEMHELRKRINRIYNKFAGTLAYDRLYELKKTQMAEAKKGFRRELESRVREPRVSDLFVDQSTFGHLRDNLLTSPIIEYAVT